MEAKELLSKIATRGDAAAAGIGFVLGLPIDYLLLHAAIPPGVASGYSAVAVWSLKNAIQSAFGAQKKARTEHDQRKRRETSKGSLEERANRLKQFLEKQNNEEDLDTLERYRDLWDMKLISDADFESCLHSMVIRSMPG